MTGAAIRNVFDAAHVVFLDQGGAEVLLIGVALAVDDYRIRTRGLLVTHVEDFAARAQVILRGAMAGQAPLHLQTFLLVHQGHLVDWAVTGVAADSFVDMNAVIEIDEVGQLVDACPLQRLAGFVAGADGLEELGVGPDLRVAVHARLGRRNASEARSLDRGVAVAAIDAESGDVVLMAERDGLRLADPGVGDVGGTLDFHGHPAEGSNYEYRAENCGAGQSIRAAMKDLRHSLMTSGLRDPADRPRFDLTGSIVRDSVEYWFGTALEKTTHWFSELSVKPEIINISPEFVADFCVSQKKKVSTETLLEEC
jgi:hypothetical protein